MNRTFQAHALNVGSETTERVARAIEAGDVAWLERLHALHGSHATLDALEAGRTVAAAKRGAREPEDT